MLIAATLAMLGVPLWLVAGVFILAFWSQRQSQKGTGVFPCRVRAILGVWGGSGVGSSQVARAMGP